MLMTAPFRQPLLFDDELPEVLSTVNITYNYDSLLGDGIQPDPISFEGEDINLYRYVGNNSVNFTDPFGLIVEQAAGMAAANFAVGAAIGAYNFAKFMAQGGNKKSPNYDKKVHCVTSCQIAKASGKLIATILGNLKEVGNPNAADQKANKDGRSTGDASGCECCCEKKGY